jgi:protein-S-isoprenylcysteine O-methyltransferase Ste14
LFPTAMPDAILYRVLFIVVYLLFFSVRGYYRFVKPRSSAPDKVEERARFGVAELLMSVAIMGYFASVILYLLGLALFSWSQVPFYPDVLRWIGLVLALFNIPLLGWIHRTLDRQYSPCLQIKESHLFIREGPYAKVRHPMYTVLSGFSLGVSLLTANAVIIGFAILVVLPFTFVARKEEQMMLETFGDEYALYMKETGRFFPSLRRSNPPS